MPRVYEYKNNYTIEPFGNHYIVKDENNQIIAHADTISECYKEVDELFKNNVETESN